MSESVNSQLACLLEKRLSAPKKTEHAIKEKQACDKWKALKSALNTASEQYKQKEKKFKFPKSMMSNIYHFNNLESIKYTLNATPSPNAMASLMDSQSAINQHPSGNAPCSIQRKAKHILKNKNLLEPKKGNRKNHKLLLENVELQKSLFIWAAT